MTVETQEERLAKRARDFAGARDVTVLIVLNSALYWLGYLILGGCVFLAEGYEGESWLRALHGDEFRVSEAVGLYSLLHGLSVFVTLPVLPFCALGILYEWVQLQRLRRLGFTRSA